MPSEAIAIRDQVPVQNGRYQMLINGQPLIDNVVLNSNYFASRTDFLLKPATVVNPFRPDGTRPPSAYHTEWLRTAQAVPAYITSQWDVSAVQSFKYSDMPVLVVHRATPFNSLESIRLGWMNLSPLDILGCDGEARTRTLNKIGTKKWDLGVTALELKQTIELVTSLSSGMLTTLDKLSNLRPRIRQQLHRFFRQVQKHDDFYRAAGEVGLKDINLLEDLKNRWMEYSFGVRPLVNDIHDAGNYLSDLIFQEQKSVLFTVRAGARRHNPDLIVTQTGPMDPITRELRGEYEIRCHYAVVYEMPIGGVGPVTELGLDNPYSIGYEVTRLSWMFDYVWDWGSWLKSLTAANGLLFREGTKSDLRRTTFHTIRTWDSNNPKLYQVRPSGPYACYVNAGQFTRSLLPSSGLMPAMLPTWKTSIGLVQMGQSLFALSNFLQGKPGLR